jgi:hypothetical protein
MDGLYDAICRTLVKDRVVKNSVIWYPTDARGFSQCFKQLWSQEKQILIKKRSPHFQKAFEAASDFYLYGLKLHEWATVPISAVESSTDRSEEFVDSIQLGMMCTRLMTASKGYVGMTHYQSEMGDLICLIQGASVPMVLRPCEGGFRLIGDAYVHGIMNGEFWAKQDANTMQEFHLK